MLSPSPALRSSMTKIQQPRHRVRAKPGRRPRAPLVLTPDERLKLEYWREHPNNRLPQRVRRARVILACAETSDMQLVAAACRVALGTVYQWRKAFVRERLESFKSWVN